MPPPDDRAFAVVLEGVRSDFKVFGESLAAFRDEVRCELQDVHRQFQGVHGRLERVEHELVLLKEVALEHGRELKEHGRELVALRVAVQTKVDRQDVEAMVRGVSGSRG